MRKWSVPEIVQTSAMDCGPASLASLLNGFGIPVSYGRLREACQTDVDGTSIDVLEVVANQLGLQAEQVMLPLDHFLLAESSALPAIVVTNTSLGQTHFVVAWKARRGTVQVMDPAVGRRRIGSLQFLRDVHLHTQPIAAEAIAQWLTADGFLSVVRRRLRMIGIRQPNRLLESSQRQDWRGIASLDAAIRFVNSLVKSRAIARGRQAEQLIASLAERALVDNATIPKAYWFVLPGSEANAVEVRIRGAVLVRAIGKHSHGDAQKQSETTPTELAAAIGPQSLRPWPTAWGFLGRNRVSWLVSALVLILVLGCLSTAELVFLRGLIDAGRDLGLVPQRLIAVGILIGLGIGLTILDLALLGTWQKFGRQLEAGFRMALALKLPRLSDRYFHSRPVSDMTERSHMVQSLRNFPKLFGQMIQTVTMLIITAAAITVFDPASAIPAIAIVGFSISLPLLFRPWLSELDMRVRTHAGALTQFYFDAMHGLSAIRAHVAERVLMREQEALLAEWVKASRRYLRVALWLEGLQLTVGIGLAAWLLARHVSTLANTGGALLLAWWALSLPELGGTLALMMRQYPTYRNILMRLLEPLSAPEAGANTGKTDDVANHSHGESIGSQDPASQLDGTGISIGMHNVGVVASGHQILHDITLDIEPGAHVAIVGPSGGGKSTLLGLLLGWHKPAAGYVQVDGAILSDSALGHLRQQTAWVDPAVQIWNESLVDNLRYGHEHVSASTIGQACRDADLIDVLEQLPEGLQTHPGEGGGLLSGGQGQRVRLGRLFAKPNARLILMDEAFRGLDRQQRRLLTDRVRRRYRKSTLLFVSHDVGDTLDFDRVLVIAEGQIVEDGAPRRLADNGDSRYRQLIDSEEALRRSIWTASAWRHLRIENGQLTEHGGASTVTASREKPEAGTGGSLIPDQGKFNSKADHRTNKKEWNRETVR